jgi:hypothetical protein
MPPPTAISGDFSGEPKKKKTEIDPATGGGRDPPQRPGERDPATPQWPFLSPANPKKSGEPKKKSSQPKKSFLMPQKSILMPQNSFLMPQN